MAACCLFARIRVHVSSCESKQVGSGSSLTGLSIHCPQQDRVEPGIIGLSTKDKLMTDEDLSYST